MSVTTPFNNLENHLICNEADGSVCVRIPEGEFEMGDGNEINRPKHTVYLDAYYIGLYPVTNRIYQRFVRETGHRKPDQATWSEPAWKNGEFPATKADHPVVCVSWQDALAYCKWAGGDLPTEAQWEKAARGQEGFLYPWGNAWDPTRCWHSRGKDTATTCSIYDYPNGISGYGVYHMAGNVWEWCRDRYDAGYYNNQSASKNPTGPILGSLIVIRGGGCLSSYQSHFLTTFRESVYLPICRADLGFRILLTPGREG